MTEKPTAEDREREAKVSGADEDESAGTYASPPCFMHEYEAEYLRFMSGPELLRLLNELLEGERAGATGVAELRWQTRRPTNRMVLRGVAADEARYCAMLTRHILRLGGRPSGETGAFLAKLRAAHSETARIDLLNKGQGWVVRRIRKDLARIADEAVRHDLEEMAKTHEANIARCEALQV